MKLAAAVVLAVLAQAVPLARAAAQDPGRPADAAAPAAPAQPPAWIPPRQPQRASTPLYVAFRGGLYQPRGEDEGDIFNNGIDLGAAFGVHVHPNVALEGGIGYYRASSDRVTISDGIDTLSAKLSLSAIPITASVRFGLPVGAVTFSALAGIGIHMAELEAEVESGDLSGSASESDTAFGLHLGGGVAVKVSERASVGAELRYSFAEATFADELDVKLDGLQLGAVLAFRL
jgi:opacity protein-like surface antigen